MLFFNVSNCSERTSSHEDSHLSNSTEQRGEATRPKLCGHLQKCWLILIQENPEGCAGVTCRNGFWWENCQQAGQKLTYRRLVTQLHQVFYINPWEINQKVEKNQNCSLVFESESESFSGFGFFYVSVWMLKISLSLSVSTELMDLLETLLSDRSHN